MTKEAEQPETRTMEFRPDSHKLAAANGDPEVWAGEIARMIEEAIGIVLAVETLVPWLTAYRRQVSQVKASDIALQIANVPITEHPMSTAMHLLNLRAALSEVAMQRAEP